MPIIFKFKDDDCGDPKQTELSPFDGERLASPLILTPYPIYTNGTVEYAPAALLICNRQYVGAIELSLVDDESKKRWLAPTGEKQKKKWHNRGWDTWPKDWQNKTKMRDIDPINKYDGTDALTAFMDFFTRKGAKR